MRIPLAIVGVLASAVAAAPAAWAQGAPASMSPAEIAAACAPPPTTTRAPHALRVLSSQDKSPRTTFDNRDLLVINGGTGAGVQIGAVFFARRTSGFGSGYLMDSSEPTITDGWVRVVAVNDTTAIARADHVCGPIFAGDYLEPFVAPQVPDEAAADRPLEPNFDSLGRVIEGAEGRPVVAAGEVAVIDRGTEQGAAPGARFAIYRDMTVGDRVIAAPHGTPLAAIGEAVVMSATGNRAIVRIVRARDAVLSGDYIAPEK